MKKRFTLSVVVLLLVLLGSTSVFAASLGDIMIVEVMFDAPNSGNHAEPQSEYFMLYNNTSSPISLNGWKICDNIATLNDPADPGCKTFEDITLASHRVLVVIHTDTTGATDPGLQAYGCASPPLHVNRLDAFVEDTWFSGNLSNTADRLQLYDDTAPTPNLIDEMSYGTNTEIFNPAVPDNGAGNAAQRLAYPWSGTLDTNENATDWESPASGGHICSISPNAVTLSSLTAHAAAPWAGIALAGLFLGALVLVRRKR